jgi:hypothetical protein
MGVDTFIWTILALDVIAVLAGIVSFATGRYDPPTPGVRAFSLVVNVGFLVWAAMLLADR